MTRFHDLDVLRAFAMFLGVLLHASVFLIPSECWPVQLGYADTTAVAANPYGYLLMFIHGFRMPVFFLLSGFFTALLWQRRGLRALGRHRLERTGLPLLVCLFTIIPATHGISTLAAVQTGKQVAGRCIALTWPPLAWLGGFYHLWFLWYLLLMAAAFIVIAKLGAQFRHARWWLVIPSTLVPQYFMRHIFGADTPFGVLPDPLVFAYYSTFFLFGVFFYRRNFQVRRWWAVAVLPAAAIFLPGLVFAYPGPFGLDATAFWVQGVSAVLQTAYAWLMCFGLMGTFRWIAARERFWSRYLSDASYWIYLAHVPLVIAGQWLTAEWPISAHLKFLLICVGVPAILLVCYQYCVRYTIIGTTLNGPRVRPAASGVAPW